MAAAVRLLSQARGIGVLGIGASGIIATYAARLFQRSGVQFYALNATGIALAEQLLELENGHVLIMLLHGRAHREAKTAIAKAGRLDIPIIMLLGREDSVLKKTRQRQPLPAPRHKRRRGAPRPRLHRHGNHGPCPLRLRRAKPWDAGATGGDEDVDQSA
ncbi:MurR/RpiR family transcriptional regulator [Agrobacterium pusense]|jgi:hypothetical protein|uniref:MurR/RpiR family transcriptional regulator n=1 Tax=Agrobacterium pusense TaxID=648995 RepID=UPI0037BEDECA